MRPQGAFSTNLMWDRAIAEGRLFGTVLDGVWIHVGTPRGARRGGSLSRRPLRRLEAAHRLHHPAQRAFRARRWRGA